MSISLSETGKDSAQISVGGITGSAELTPSDGKREPETIHISLPALRAVVLGLIDDGQTKGQLNLPWFFYRSPSTADIAIRLDFCDELEKRLRQLPVRG